MDVLQERLERIDRQIAFAEELKRKLSAVRIPIIVSCVCNHYYRNSDGDVKRSSFELKKNGATEDEARDNVLKSCEAKLESTGSYSDAHIGHCQVKN